MTRSQTYNRGTGLLSYFTATAGLVAGSRNFGRETLSITTRPDGAGLATTTVTQPDGTI